MIFEPLKFPGAYLIKPEHLRDERGYFARSFCKQTFRDQGLVDEFEQCSISFNRSKGILRGMHFQKPPYRETKLVRCTQGRIYDVVVDIRPDSDQYLEWQGIELTSARDWILYVPAGFAHGFTALEDNTSVFYQISPDFQPDFAAGFCWDDPRVGIDWPLTSPILSQRDRDLPTIDRLVD